MKKIRTAFLLTALALPSLHAQDVIRVETREVLVDVAVRGLKDTASAHLTAKDFSVWEDGKAQKINSVSSASADPDASQKHFVIYLDFSMMRTDDQAASVKFATGFVDGMASPDRYMAVATMNTTSTRILQNFTNSREVLKKAVAAPLSGMGTGSVSVFASGTPAPVIQLADSLIAVCQSIAKAPGRKAILLFSGINTANTDPLRPVTTACNRANVAIYLVTSKPESATNFTSEMSRRLPAGGPLGGPGSVGGVMANISQQSTGILAELLGKETGGGQFDMNESLPEKLVAIAREQDDYYRVAYTPPPANEGSCHKLKVTTAARGASIHARNEYCTEKPVDLVAGKIAGQGLESRAGTGNLTAAMQLPFFYTGTNRASVHLVADIIPAGMKFEKDKAGLHGQIDIVGTSLRADGGTAARFADTVNIDLPDQQHAEAFTKTVYRYDHQFTTAAGAYTFQLAIGAGPNAVARLEAPLAIAPWNSAAFGASALALSADTHPAPAADSSEGPVLEGKGPLTVSGRQFVAAAANRFSRTIPLYFYMEIYAPGGPEGLTLQYRILDPKSGEVRADSGVGTISSFIRPGNPVIPLATRLPVTEVPPGSYRLEVRAAGGPGAAPETRSIDFELN